MLSVGQNLHSQMCRALVLLSVAATLTASPDSRDSAGRKVTKQDATMRKAMIGVLGSENPNPSLGDEAHTFDQLVGTWDADFTMYPAEGPVLHKKGEILFGWILDGRAIQDLWISYPTGDGKERSIGTTIRFFDTALKQWRIVYVNPQRNYLVTLQGKREGDRIVLRGLDSDGSPIRWSFSEITPDSFHWQGEKLREGGERESWRLEGDFHMKRRST
jgi:hypothetical protein